MTNLAKWLRRSLKHGLATEAQWTKGDKKAYPDHNTYELIKCSQMIWMHQWDENVVEIDYQNINNIEKHPFILFVKLMLS